MASNPYLRSIAEAVRYNERLGTLFYSLGMRDYPNGSVLKIYRRVKAELQEKFKSGAIAREDFQELMDLLVMGVRAEVLKAMKKAQTVGIVNARRQLEFYDFPFTDAELAELEIDFVASREAALGAVDAILEAQTAQALAMLGVGVDPATIVGSPDNQGVLRPTKVLETSATWLAELASQAFRMITEQHPVTDSGTKFKQAIATLDGRTTRCCLRVHGQIKPFDEPFELSDTPCDAYAGGSKDWMPFHWYCRTSGVVYSERYDMGFTDRMRASADYVLSLKNAGKPFDQHPSDAFVNGF